MLAGPSRGCWWGLGCCLHRGSGPALLLLLPVLLKMLFSSWKRPNCLLMCHGLQQLSRRWISHVGKNGPKGRGFPGSSVTEGRSLAGPTSESGQLFRNGRQNGVWMKTGAWGRYVGVGMWQHMLQVDFDPGVYVVQEVFRVSPYHRAPKCLLSCQNPAFNQHS